jgi:hypothetical protein
MPALRRSGVRAVSPNGVLGDPAGASAGEGAALLDRLLAGLLAMVAAWDAEGALGAGDARDGGGAGDQRDGGGAGDARDGGGARDAGSPGAARNGGGTEPGPEPRRRA